MDESADRVEAIEAASVQLASGPSAPLRAREWLGWLAQHLSAERFDAARLIVSELVTNSVEHSGLVEGAPIHLTGVADGRRIQVCVCDCGAGFAPSWPPSLPELDASGGRGLWLVHQLADRVLIDGAKGKVSFELRQSS